jgi:hypothetical protein
MATQKLPLRHSKCPLIARAGRVYDYIRRASAQHWDAPRFPAKAKKMTTKYAELFDKYFYFTMSLIIAAVVIYGFSHTINENLIHPAYPRPLVLYVHAAIFAGWVVLLFTQSALIRTRNVRLHRKLGLCALALARHPALRPLLAQGRHEHRAWVAERFGSTQSGLSALERERQITRLIVATDIYTWKLLRRDFGRSQDEVLHLMVGIINKETGEVT